MFKWDKDPAKALSQLAPKLAKSVGKKAMRKAVKPIQAAVKATAPKDTGALRQSVSARVDTANKNPLSVYGVVGVRSKWTKEKDGKMRRPSRYAHLVERKTHWQEMALRQSRDQFFNILKAELAAAIIPLLTQ